MSKIKNITMRVTESERDVIQFLRGFDTSLLIRVALTKNIEDKIELIDKLKTSELEMAKKYVETLESEIAILSKITDLLVNILE